MWLEALALVGSVIAGGLAAVTGFGIGSRTLARIPEVWFDRLVSGHLGVTGGPS
jgi:hypothetical protein